MLVIQGILLLAIAAMVVPLVLTYRVRAEGRFTVRWVPSGEPVRAARMEGEWGGAVIGHVTVVTDQNGNYSVQSPWAWGRDRDLRIVLVWRSITIEGITTPDYDVWEWSPGLDWRDVPDGGEVTVQ